MAADLSMKELSGYIDELMENQAFELHFAENPCGDRDVLIPYVMNDAVECYLRLQEAECSGSWDPEEKGEFFYAYTTGEDRYGLILEKADGEELQIWFRDALLEMHPYQYHRIGHDWRKEEGEEHWRRLVNLLCVLHDKYTYLGEEACNALELSLYPLIEYAPLCYWTPIDDSISDWYPETMEGIDAMLSLTLETKDLAYAEMIRSYKQSSEDRRREQAECLARALLKEEHAALFYRLQAKIEEASLFWPVRSYPQEEEYAKLRQKLISDYQEMGYQVEYPYAEKDGEHLLFAEELPFTVMEWKDYRYKILPIRLP